MTLALPKRRTRTLPRLSTLCHGTLATLALMLLSACGGGGGGSSPANSAGSYPTSAACAAKRDVAGSDVVLMIGQSNMVGFGAYTVAAFDTTDPRILQWGRSGTAVLATEPLQHPDPIDLQGRIGLGLAFARAYLKPLPAQRNVLLVPAAYGGTGFAGKRWNPGDDLYTDALRRARLALQSNPSGNCLAAFLWSQGESDVDAMTSSAYANALDRMIQSMRTELPADSGARTAPFLLSQFSPEWLLPTPSAGQQAILDAINTTPARLPYTAVVSANGLRSNLTQGLNFAIHIDAASLRIYGQRFYETLPQALGNLPR